MNNFRLPENPKKCYGNEKIDCFEKSMDLFYGNKPVTLWNLSPGEIQLQIDNLV
jgi:hypothetical protein